MKKILGLGVDVRFPVELQQQRQEWLSSLFQDTAVVVRAIQKGPAYLQSYVDHALAGKGILEEVIKAETEGFDAVCLLCTTDPFLDACREAVRIPIVGAGQASFLLAVATTNRVSVISPSENAFIIYKNVLKTLGIDKDIIASIRSIDLNVEQMNKDPKLTIQRMKKEGLKALKEDKAQSLVLGCCEMSQGSTKTLSRQLGVPIIEPNEASIAIAHALLGTGIFHCQLSSNHKECNLERRYIKKV